MKSAYEGEDLDDMLSESTRVPNPKNKDGSDNSAECRVFKMKFGKAKSILFSALDTSEFKLITRCTSIYEMIQTLQTRRDRSITVYSIMEDFHKCTWLRGESVDEFISRLNKFRSQLTAKSVTPDDTSFIQKIINQLPPFMSCLKNSFQVDLAKNQTLKYDEVCLATKKYYDTVYDPNHKSKPTSNPPSSFGLVADPHVQKKWCSYHKSNRHSNEECRRLKKKQQYQQSAAAAPAQRTASTQPPSTTISTPQMANPAFNSTNPPLVWPPMAIPAFNSVNQPRTQPPQPPATSTASTTSQIKIPDLFGMTAYTRDESGKVTDVLFDSASTNFMSPFIEDFQSIEQIQDGPTVATGNGPVRVEGVGDVHITSFNGEEHIPMKFKASYYIPSLPARLFSEPLARLAGLSVQTIPSKGQLLIKNADNQVIFTGTAKPNTTEIFRMSIRIVKPPSAALVSFSEPYIHHSWGHCPPDVVHQTIDNELVPKVTIIDCDHQQQCAKGCIEGKTQAKPH